MLLAILVLLPFLAISPALADRRLDEARLGSFYTSLPLYRSGAGTNILPVGIGSPPQKVNLTLTTNVPFVAVVGEDCQRCTEQAERYNSDDSTTYDLSRDAVAYSAIYPVGSQDYVQMNGIFGQDLLIDDRGDSQNPRPIATISSLRQDPTPGGGGTAFRLSAGSSGFWGLGIFQTRKNKSILDSVLLRDNDGRPKSAQSYTVGFDIGNYSRAANSQAGLIHWGGVPQGVYQGDFQWMDVDTSKAGSWAIPVDRMRVGSTVLDTETMHGSLDPGYDSIFVPTSIAERIFSTIPEAARDRSDASRWNVPCDLNISMTITLGGHEYNVKASELVQSRDAAGRSCWSSIVAWSNGSVPEAAGEIRLGTPFLSGVYSAIYYNPNEQYVGIAGKPGSVNALNVNDGDSGGGGANLKLAGILIGSLLAALIIFLAICYSRNRNSVQSMWYRAIRRQHRVATNAVVRGATLPPAMVIPPTMPLMGPRPMGPMGMGPMGMPPMGPMGPMGPMNPMGRMMGMAGPMGGYPGQMGGMNGTMFAPPAYQHPMQGQQLQQQQQGGQPQGQGARTGVVQGQQGQGKIPQQPNALPTAVEHQPQGFYSPRQQDSGTVAGINSQTGPAAAGAMPAAGVRRHSSEKHYQGVPHPGRHAQHAQYVSPPARSSRSIRFGANPSRSKSAKHSSLPVGNSSSGTTPPIVALADTKARRVSTGTAMRDGAPQGHDAWLNAYSGAGQNQQPYPAHRPPRVETRYNNDYSSGEALDPIRGVEAGGDVEKRGGRGSGRVGAKGAKGVKRPWSWGRGSKSRSGGSKASASEKGYEPVQGNLGLNMGDGGDGGRMMPAISEKRRSWFGRYGGGGGGGGGRGVAAAEGARMKHLEREREREGLAAQGGAFYG